MSNIETEVKKKEKKYLSDIGEYKGKSIFRIWEVSEDGLRRGEFPLISFGVKKARVLLDNLSAVQSFSVREE